MTKQYDLVVTSGGIGPTHDGKLSNLRAGNTADRQISLTLPSELRSSSL
jgi:molybdopterin-biosynthesis enzyme MoeA-like protein